MIDTEWWLPIAGGAIGVLFGAVARRDHFCTLAALERHWYAGDSHGLRTWVLAVAVAIIVTQALSLGGLIDVSKSFYLTINFGWAGAILGGLAFGFGMAGTLCQLRPGAKRFCHRCALSPGRF